MLALLLGVLKIVGIVLLIILGIILLLILLVLLVPIRYRVEGAFDGKPAGLAKVTWLLHLISAKAEYQEALDVTVRVLGFRVFNMKLPEEAGADASPKTKPDAGSKTKSHGKASSGAGEDTDEDAGTENLKGCESGTESKEKNAEKPGKKEIDREDDGGVRAEAKTEIKAETISIEETQLQSSPFFFTGIYEKLNAKCVGTIRGILQKIRSAAAAAREKIQAIRDKEEWAVAFLKNKDNQKTFGLLKRQIFRLIRHILPQKLSGRVKFGFDDPSTTGQILTYISPFYGCYAGKLELIPVFEEKVLEGKVSLKGRVRILTVLWIAARMLFDRNFRKLICWFLDRER